MSTATQTDNTIQFSKNWNHKLNNDFFTRIALKNPKKYYPGARLKIHCNEVYIYDAEIVDIKEFLLNEIDPWYCYIDAAMTKAQLCDTYRKMYPDVNFDEIPLIILLLKKL
jgi:hypothetical protein